MAATLVAGQQLWFVPASRRGEPRWVTVESVGRKWASIGPRLRISVETLIADGGGVSTPGRCYPTREEWERGVALDSTWRAFRKAVVDCSGAPKGLDAESVLKAAEILGVDIRAAAEALEIDLPGTAGV